MLYHSDDLALAHAAQRREQLLKEAAAHRQARAASRTPAANGRTLSAHSPAYSRPSRSDRLYLAAGSLLVRWGTQLQQRSRTALAGAAAADTLVESRGA